MEKPVKISEQSIPWWNFYLMLWAMNHELCLTIWNDKNRGLKSLTLHLNRKACLGTRWNYCLIAVQTNSQHAHSQGIFYRAELKINAMSLCYARGQGPTHPWSCPNLAEGEPWGLQHALGPEVTQRGSGHSTDMGISYWQRPDSRILVLGSFHQIMLAPPLNM